MVGLVKADNGIHLVFNCVVMLYSSPKEPNRKNTDTISKPDILPRPTADSLAKIFQCNSYSLATR